jgi:hypothetical protein
MVPREQIPLERGILLGRLGSIGRLIRHVEVRRGFGRDAERCQQRWPLVLGERGRGERIAGEGVW